ncbi:hypothetical protein CEXT_113021 [Caerostris extrusa]|uniref:Uncharacterized protein n=1 Tax=Caerostris extrusa TaxID=172846 RepID=A0AAV4Q948_CAEEX|nr:hypothetical protein CEXT_113021 [Caerostris extrusa]
MGSYKLNLNWVEQADLTEFIGSTKNKEIQLYRKVWIRKIFAWNKLALFAEIWMEIIKESLNKTPFYQHYFILEYGYEREWL